MIREYAFCDQLWMLYVSWKVILKATDLSDRKYSFAFFNHRSILWLNEKKMINFILITLKLYWLVKSAIGF